MPHLLIDRFRFDSFAPDSDEEDGSRLLTRFGAPGLHVLHDHAAGSRPSSAPGSAASEVGRYKAVDDLARPQHRGLYRACRACSSPGRCAPTSGSTTSSSTTACPSGRAAAHRRLRLERRDEHPRRQVPARRRALPQDRRPGQIPGGGLSRRADARARQQSGLPARMRTQPAGDQLRRARQRDRLRAHGSGPDRLDRPGRARPGDGRRRHPRRPLRAGAGRLSGTRRVAPGEISTQLGAHRRPMGAMVPQPPRS